MSQRIIVDPITRIEGHLRIEVVVDDNNVVQEAYAGSTLWRGIETIVKGRDPRDIGFMTQRICGVCTFSHYKAGIVAVENALGIEPPLNALLTRTLMNIALFLHDHIVHFYQLHGLDWVDIVSALGADVKKASDLAFNFTPNPYATGADKLLEVQQRVKAFVDKGNLGPFANAYYGHPTYHLSAEENLIALSHYLECLKIQRSVAQAMAIFGSKQPHPQSLSVGGVTCVMDLLSPARMGEYLVKIQEVTDFINRAYYPDLIMAGKAYANEPSVLNDVGVTNLFTFQEFQLGKNEWLFESGIIKNGDISKVYEVEEDKITEEATHSWYADNEALHPYDGKTNPNYTGLVDGESIDHHGQVLKGKVFDLKGKYSWIKAPRYDGMPMQVGPLANVVINYAKGNANVVPIVDEFLKDTGLPLEAVFSTLGRTATRCLEAKIIATHGLRAFNNLIENLKIDESTYTTYKIDPNKEYKGRYIGHVPRGTLSHWCRIKNGVIENWQAVVPSTWNASPKDANGVGGSYEQCLIGLKIADVKQPLEIIRKIHSYDPCIACAVHVMDTKGNELSEYKVNVNL
ncbi:MULTISPECIES: nickel-dependent hydrogenase large subunit [unclassified Campylobacter]|uniref:nickel-dependent hydrogenase large subunit n=1 Tax=unclassified Campylobacter TaxID=2593542 RepID=UPI001237D447|nr:MULTISPECIES: nickel-dependent hydrogenase large subunit [unclassified Campylobacter]KAA6224720.1 nickel-dependent hydrogenase large subunit [Campylobacter sp. LR185c]KAA6225718.1 nickel-dependent hydrogenase large subunit [Campylobacter sp. LR286c]KAA6225838.1 nickel-dependent hydrogenase large subunit [Campylobacter sp. LR196d]KAA6229691.1 nickel-dependent hydrogenase large subunit [Campylobacter sp. LR291e]KAA6230063.1 nickel-dependent hydrogenase large subunit [Campylobacter sp. LR264d]